MKISNQNNQLIIKNGGIGQIFAGLVFTIAGIGFAALILLGIGQQSGNKAIGAGIALLFAVIGIAIILFAKSQTVSIIKGGSTDMTIKRLIGGKTTNQSFPTESITSVLLQTDIDRDITHDNDGGTSTTTSLRSTVSLQLSDGSMVTLGSKSGGSSTFNGFSMGGIRKSPLQQEAQMIAEYLQVPVQSLNPGMSPTNLMNAMQNGQQGTPITSPAPSAPTATPPSTPIIQQPAQPVNVVAPQPQVVAPDSQPTPKIQ